MAGRRSLARARAATAAAKKIRATIRRAGGTPSPSGGLISKEEKQLAATIEQDKKIASGKQLAKVAELKSEIRGLGSSGKTAGEIVRESRAISSRFNLRPGATEQLISFGSQSASRKTTSQTQPVSAGGIGGQAPTVTTTKEPTKRKSVFGAASASLTEATEKSQATEPRFRTRVTQFGEQAKLAGVGAKKTATKIKQVAPLLVSSFIESKLSKVDPLISEFSIGAQKREKDRELKATRAKLEPDVLKERAEFNKAIEGLPVKGGTVQVPEKQFASVQKEFLEAQSAQKKLESVEARFEKEQNILESKEFLEPTKVPGARGKLIDFGKSIVTTSMIPASLLKSQGKGVAKGATKTINVLGDPRINLESRTAGQVLKSARKGKKLTGRSEIDIIQGLEKIETTTKKRVKSQAEFVGGVVEGATAFPKDKPIQAASFALIPGLFKGASAAAKIAIGKPIIFGAKAGALKAAAVRGLTTTGIILGSTAKAAVGVGFAKSRVDAIKAETTPRGKGKVVGETAAGLAFLKAGSALTLGSRMQERFELTTKGPITVAERARFSTPENIRVVQKVGKAALRASGRGDIFPAQREVPFARQPRKASRFFKAKPKRGPKGSRAGAAVLEKDLLQKLEKIKLPKRFKPKGKQKEVDLDALIGRSEIKTELIKPDKILGGTKVKLRSGGTFEEAFGSGTQVQAVDFQAIPGTGTKADIKAFEDAIEITGARSQQFTPKGVPFQAGKEFIIRKAIGGMDFKIPEGKKFVFGETKAEFVRFGKDIAGDFPIFLEQAIRGGASGLGKLQVSIDKAIAGKSGVTLPLTPKGAPPADATVKNILAGPPRVRRVSRGRRTSRLPSISASILSSLSPLPSISKVISPSVVSPSQTSPSPSPPSISSLLPSPPSPSPPSSGSPSISRPSPSPSPPSTSPSQPSSPSPSISKIVEKKVPFTFKLELFPVKGKRKKKKLFGSRQFRFQPSLVAVTQQIRGKKPKRLTGLEVRPIPIKF